MFHDQKEKKTYVQRKFSKVNRRYDLVNTIGSFGVDHWWRYEAVRELSHYPGPILDICAGTLSLAKEIVRQRPRMVVAVDICLDMLNYGLKRLETHPASSFIQSVCGDGERLPFPDNIFCGETVAFGVRNLANLEQGLSEMYRVLRPGGKAVILEFSRPSAMIFARLYRFYLDHILSQLGGWLTGDKDAYQYLAKSIAAFLTPEELANLMNKVGFKKVSYRPLTLKVVTIYTGIKS